MWVETARGLSTNDPNDINLCSRCRVTRKISLKKGATLANSPGSIIRKNGRNELRKGDGSSDVALNSLYELGLLLLEHILIPKPQALEKI